MDKSIKYSFDWDETNGITTCRVNYKGLEIIGIAKCMEQDLDMKNRRTGETIAHARANIKLHKHIRDNEIRPAKKALVHVAGCLAQKNINSYEYEFVLKELKKYDEELIMINEIIEKEKAYLKQFMSDKAEFYKTIRENRNKDKAVKGK